MGQGEAGRNNPPQGFALLVAARVRTVFPFDMCVREGQGERAAAVRVCGSGDWSALRGPPDSATPAAARPPVPARLSAA